MCLAIIPATVSLLTGSIKSSFSVILNLNYYFFMKIFYFTKQSKIKVDLNQTKVFDINITMKYIHTLCIIKVEMGGGEAVVTKMS